ncbi:branched-chain amino acid transport [Skermanella stibiiresistens SB22]|uniref:Branched-chain amino acid transport n=1 Tax=Skermanella stibiiresistens SB22 TaxID=1385369 RepID=W9HDJ6_9PROT|nr:AzlD domain-containing protein [Skermanella stibiiresistens]EWY41973.1 branched-chain amino acid transport [Skermanella stibiiresistens SB22]
MSEGAGSQAWIIVVLLAGAVATYVWRALGVALSGRINPGGPVFEWVGCVAYALLAGLIARMIVMPVGPLQTTDLGIRILSAVLALAVFFAFRKNIFLGVTAGTLALIALTLSGIRLF